MWKRGPVRRASESASESAREPGHSTLHAPVLSIRAASSVAGLVARVVVVVVAASGCVTSAAKVRVIERVGGARDQIVWPERADDAVAVDVGRAAATDAELDALRVDVAAALAARVGAPDATLSLAAPRVGVVRVVRANVKASPGREQHRYLGSCRLRVTDGDAVIADVEGEVLRLVRAQNLSVVELAGITEAMQSNGGRMPLLAADDVRAVVVDACVAAFDAASADVRPDDNDVDRSAGVGAARAGRAAARAAARARALEKLQKQKSVADVAAALVDLGAVGDVDDAAVVGARLYDEHALVARAAAAAFRQLCAAQPRLAPAQTAACTAPTPPPPPPPPAPVVDDANADLDGGSDDDDGPIRGAPTTEPTSPTAPAPTPTTEPAAPTTPTTTTTTTTSSSSTATTSAPPPPTSTPPTPSTPPTTTAPSTEARP